MYYKLAIVYTHMWNTILIGLAAVNILLLLVYLTGFFGIVFTWIPGPTIVIALTLLAVDNKEERSVAILNNIATHIIPVLFLNVFRLGIHNYKGRQPRFARDWSTLWLVAILVMLATFASLWLTTSPIIFGIIGVFSLIVNFVNIKDIVKIQTIPIQITWFYVVGANLLTVGIIYTLLQLTVSGQSFVASIISNIPFFSIILLAQSTCYNAPNTSQNIYLVAFQIWPSLIFMTTVFFGQDLPIVQCISLACVMTTIAIGIQFVIIMKKIY